MNSEFVTANRVLASAPMSETLRPWLRQYILEHAQQHGLDLDNVKSITRVCQLMHVSLCYARTPATI